jgi:hypothetical protein
MELFPAPEDIKNLAVLMKVVKSAEILNTKFINIVAHAAQFGGIVLTSISSCTNRSGAYLLPS